MQEVLLIDQNAGYVKFVCRQARKHPISDLSVYKLYTLVLELSPLARDDNHANKKQCDKPNSTTAKCKHRGSRLNPARIIAVGIVGCGGIRCR